MAEATPRRPLEALTGKGGPVLDFFHLTAEGEGRLRTRIGRFGGLIRIFVHPFYEEYRETRCWDEFDKWPKVERPRIGLTKLLSLTPDKTPPIFVFEEQQNMSETGDRLAQMNLKSGNEAYLVSTHSQWSAPRLPSSEDRVKMDEDWIKLTEIFKDLGITRIILGGQRLIIEPGRRHKNSNGTGYIAFRCVGAVIKNMGKDFNIDISTFTHPHSRIDISQIGPKYAYIHDRLSLRLDYQS